MSGRRKKTPSTIKTTPVAAGTSQSPVVSQSPRSGRPPSELMISREEEKKSLASLNDRLAAYLDRMRQLEDDNSHLLGIVQSYEQTETVKVTEIRSAYERELNSAHELNKELAKENAELQFENGKLKTDLESLRAKYD